MPKTNRALQSRNYGYQVEVALRDKYNLETDQNSWHDARRPNGEPVEIKSAKRKMNNGRPGRVLIRKDAHDRLQSADGWYAFAVYRGRGSGIDLLDATMRRARAVRINSWQSVGPNNRAEKQIQITDVI